VVTDASSPLVFLDARQLAALLHSRELSAVEVMRAFLRRSSV
jgi:Asp-tRNA(Asn)/Glu-tRNA(Gln) amidotransferase A subunit family amidase